MSETLVRLGYPVHLLQAGGEIRARGQKANGPWKIGIKNPRATSTVTALVVLESGKAISTSGDYERFFIHQGTRYHHLLDPQTGWPARNGVASVTLLCSTSAQCDLWSKPLYLLGPTKGKPLADSLGISALWVRETSQGLCGTTTASWKDVLQRDTLPDCP
jgi:thiamine biosynthesis lipoprotein